MILVVGGSGRLGRRVVAGLVAQGEEVSVLCRGLVPFDAPAGVRVRQGDIRDAAAVGQAVRGARLVVSAVQGLVGRGRVSPATVDRDGNAVLIDSAAREGADVVLVSVADAALDSPTELGRMKGEAELHLRRSACPGTVVRPAPFIQTWLEILEQSAGRAGRPVVLGRGDNPLAWVSVDDVAALVVRCALDPGLRGRTLDVVGPQPVSLTELAAALMAARGWSGQPRHVPRPALRAAAMTVGRVVPRVGRLCRMALAMDDMTPTDDRATRLLVTGLPATPPGDVIGLLPSSVPAREVGP